MKVSPQARRKNPDLPEYWDSYTVKTRLKTLLTSLPAGTYSVKAVAKLYQERWGIELGFSDIKSSMQNNAITLRCKKVELTCQEVRGVLLTYNVIRRETCQAALVFDRNPSDISFKAVCHYIAVQVIVMAGAQPASGTGR